MKPTRKIDMEIAEALGWRWIEVPKFDARGPLPEQGPMLAPPAGLPDGYEWPRVGIVPPDFMTPRFSTDREACEILRRALENRGHTWMLCSPQPGVPEFGFVIDSEREPEHTVETGVTEELATCRCMIALIRAGRL